MASTVSSRKSSTAWEGMASPPQSPPDGSTLSNVAEEQMRLRQKRDALKASHGDYLASHPELPKVVNDLVGAVLQEKPNNVFDFAKQVFSSTAEDDEAGEGGVKRPVVFAGPSGAGKGTIIKRVMDKYPSKFGFSVSHTTRAPREGEEDGVHYNFTTKSAMKESIDKGLFIEHAEVHGNYYGTSFAAVEKVSRAGQVCILDIDIQGVQNVKKSSLLPYYVFITPPSLEVLEQRLIERKTETAETLKTRLGNANKEMEEGRKEGAFDTVIVNDELDTAVEELAQRLRQWFPHLEA